MTFVLTMLVVPLSRTNPRDGHYGRVLAAVLVFIVYSNFLTVSEEWLEDGRLPVWIGTWWVHGLMLAVAVAWLVKGFGAKALLPHLWKGKSV
jgi:lipopolysaccharide export system permease protein